MALSPPSCCALHGRRAALGDGAGRRTTASLGHCLVGPISHHVRLIAGNFKGAKHDYLSKTRGAAAAGFLASPITVPSPLVGSRAQHSPAARAYY
jgi:hypothetical protein